MNRKWYYMFLVVSFALLMTASLRGYGAATIWTDKTDYSSGDTAIVSGSGFLPNVQITVLITHPDSIVDTKSAGTDASGAFTCNYQLDGITGTYTVTATDGTNTASTTFTDTKPTFSITIDTINGHSWPYPTLTNPIHLAGHASSTHYPGQLSSYQVQVNWADGTVDADSTVNFVASGNDFSGTWSSDPDHSYASGGTFIITVKLYHQMPPGAESGDAIATATIEVAPPQYQLTMATNFGTTNPSPGIHSYTAGSLVTISATAPVAGAGERYVWNGWTGSGASGKYSGSSNPAVNAVTMNGAITETASWTHQYKLTVNSDHDSPAPTVGDHWYDTGTHVDASVTSPADDDLAGTRYRCTGRTGSGSATSGSETSFDFDIAEPSSITWNWIVQYYLTVNTSPASIDSPTGEDWYDTGVTAHVSTAQYEDIVSGSSRYRFNSWTGASGTFSDATVVMDAAKTATANYVVQFYVTFAQSGVGSDFTGTVMTVGGVDYNRDGHSDWYDSSASIVYSYGSPLSVDAGKRYFKTSTDASPLTVSAATTVTGTYKTQYYLTVENGGHGTSGGEGWYDANTNAHATITPLTVAGTSGTQYVFAGWSGAATGSGSPSDDILMTGPKTATATWTTQYYLTVASDHDTPTGEGWYDSGATPSVGMTDTTVSGGTGVQYVFTGWSSSDTGGYTGSDASHSVTMNNPITETANWKTQYLVSFTQTGSAVPPTVDYTADTDPTGTVPFSIWVKGGSTITYTYQAIVPDGPGVQFVLTGVTPASAQTVNGPLTIVGNYKTQYYLTVLAYGDGSWRDLVPPVTPPSGWFDAGTPVTLNAPQVTHDAQGNTYIFYGYWSVNGQLMIGNTVQIIMDSAKTAIAWYCDPPMFTDVNNDGRINVADLAIVARHYGEVRTNPNYNPLFDINGDGRIDLRDMAAVARSIARAS